MNSTTGTLPTTSASASAVATVPSPAIDELNSRLASLEQQRDAILKERAAAEAAAIRVAEQRKVIDTFPGLLGVEGLNEVHALMQAIIGGVTTVRHSPKKGGFPERIPAGVLTQMKEMLVKGNNTARQIATALSVSIASVRAYKKRWGLTEAPTKRRGAAKVGGVKRVGHVRRGRSPYLTDERRAKLIGLLAAGNTSVAKLAIQFGVSRQTIYNVADKAGLKTPAELKVAA